MAQTSNCSEADIIRGLVKRGAVTEICRELNTTMLSSPKPSARKGPIQDALDEQGVRDQLRQVTKIWTALTKLVRSQCNKDRIIDSLFFGSFGKSSVMNPDAGASKTYSYCPGPRAVFTLNENAENLKSVPQEVNFILFFS